MHWHFPVTSISTLNNAGPPPLLYNYVPAPLPLTQVQQQRRASRSAIKETETATPHYQRHRSSAASGPPPHHPHRLQLTTKPHHIPRTLLTTISLDSRHPHQVPILPGTPLRRLTHPHVPPSRRIPLSFPVCVNVFTFHLSLFHKVPTNTFYRYINMFYSQ